MLIYPPAQSGDFFICCVGTNLKMPPDWTEEAVGKIDQKYTVSNASRQCEPHKSYLKKPSRTKTEEQKHQKHHIGRKVP
jgi:hypothetical protein